MTNDWETPIVEIENVREHPNADKLELCNVLGYQLCVEKGLRKNGDRLVYFPPDTELPVELVDELGISDYLRGKLKNRVGQIKLRGEPSFGLLIDIPEELKNCDTGTNVIDFFGAKKYEPPLVFPNAMSQNNKQSKKDPLFDKYIQRYTKIQNGRMNTSMFTESDTVCITEKLHGCNSKLGYIRPLDSNFAASMGRGDFSGRRKCPEEEDNSNFIKRIWNNYWRKANKKRMMMREITDYSRDEIKTNTYWFPWSVDGVEEMVKSLTWRENAEVVIIYGEIFGGSIQPLTYGIPKGKGYGFRVFDISINGRYLDWHETASICNIFGVETVPILYEGSFNLGMVNEFAEGTTTLQDSHIREGCVIRTIEEQTHPRIGRKILKYISNDYMLSKHKEKDTTDI